MEVVQEERVDQLQDYVAQVETIICSAINHKTDELDHIKVLTRIFGKGRTLSKQLLEG